MAKKIVIEHVKMLLKNGCTRKKGDNNYDPEVRSIEEIFKLTKSQVDLLFKDSRLSGLRMVPRKKPVFELVEGDVPENPFGDHGCPSANMDKEAEENTAPPEKEEFAVTPIPATVPTASIEDLGGEPVNQSPEEPGEEPAEENTAEASTEDSAPF